VTDWFTPANWSFLDANNLDVSANGVTLIPGTNLAFNGGKIGVIYLLNQTNLGGLEPGGGNAPLQQFQASHGCGSEQCGQHLPTAYWPHAADPKLYVWDIYDTLRAIPFDLTTQRFVPASATVGQLLPSRAGGMTVSSNSSTAETGIVWATTAAADPFSAAVPGTLRAFNANDITQELYSSDRRSCRDSMGAFVKMSTPIVANGKVYVNTHSDVLPVYGLLSSIPPGTPPAGTIHVIIQTSVAGPTIVVDGNAPCTGPAEFDWTPGSSHTIAVSSPQVGLPGTAPQATAPGTQYVWTGWSDGGTMAHTVSPHSATTFTATFSTRHLLTQGSSPEAAGSIDASPASASGYYDAGTAVQLTAAPIANCSFVSWAGALSGAANPQTVLMTGPQTVTANYQCSTPPPTSFVTGYSQKILRNDFAGWVGTRFTVGANALAVSALGRIWVYGNSAAHTVKLVKASDGTDVPGGSVTLSAAGGVANKFKYGVLASPVNLQPNTTYYLVTQETEGGDQWYDFGGIAATNVASVISSIYSANGVSWSSIGTTNTSYGPVSFLYTVGAAVQYPLTTSISPGGSGSIDASPAAAGGTYTAGSVVQLTAAPASGCNFVNWTGALTGSGNPQPVTMSAARSVTANFQCSGPSATALVTSWTPTSLRRDFTGWVGFKFTVGANPLPVTSVGRVCVAGNVAAHAVKIVNASDGSVVPGASVTVNMAGCTPGQFAYAAASATLAASTTYYLVSQETYNGDQWYDQGSIAATNVAAVNSSVYSNGAGWSPIGAPNTSYVPVNLQYSLAAPPIRHLLTLAASPSGYGSIAANPASADGYYDAGTIVSLTATPAGGCSFTGWDGALSGSVNPQPVTLSAPRSVTANFQCSTPPGQSFLTGFALNNPSLRRDFTGWVGMRFTTGASAMTISSLGRICVAGNAATHAVKLVSAATNSDVTSASVNMAACSAGQFVYAPIAPVVLPAGASFYLASQEVSGGDQWYDLGGVSATNAAVVNSAVYSSGSSWLSIGAVNSSYVPANFLYSTGGPTQYTLTTNVSPAAGGTIASNPPGGTYNAGTVVQMTASPAAGCAFLNWSGALSGATNPQSVAMSGAQTVTANFQCSGPSGTSFITSFSTAGRPLRNDFSGWVGMKITVGASPLTVSALGRACATGNTGTHQQKLVNASTGADVVSATVSMAGCTPGQFVYGATSAVLPAGSSYFLMSQETSGGDRWHDQGPVSATSAASIPSAAYSSGANWIAIGSANSAYVPVSFLYSTGGPAQYPLTALAAPAGGGTIALNPPGGTYASGTVVQLTATPAPNCSFTSWTGDLTGATNPQSITMSVARNVTANFQCTAPSGTSFVTAFSTAGRALRNDFTGWVGMKFTTGSSPLTIVSLGRICVAGNSGTHVVKLLSAASTSVLAIASVSMSGCTPGQFVYASASAALTASTAYYLASQEIAGGDRWYDQGPVSTTGVAAINSSAYSSGASWIPIGSANTSYGPPNFQYTVGSPE
jgi:hypothetical protein